MFPKKTTIYLHSCKEEAWNLGIDLGLSKEAIKNNFRFCLCEIGIDVEVYEDGTYKILGVKE